MENELKKIIKCKKCFSSNLRLEKWVFGNKKNRWQKRIKIICLDCGEKQVIKITKFLFELMRWMRWRHKRKKSLEKEGLDYLIISS